MQNRITVGDGPWDVVLIYDEWCISHRDPKRGRKGRRTIGPARSRGTNHFDRAVAEAEKRNADHKRLSAKFTLDDEAPKHELGEMVRSESGYQEGSKAAKFELKQHEPDDYSRALTDALEVIARYQEKSRLSVGDKLTDRLLEDLRNEIVDLGR